MDVIVDGQRNFRLEGEPADVLAAVGAVNDFLRAQHRAILSVEVDGEAVHPENLLARLSGLPLDAVTTLIVGSEDIATMVEQCLGELQEALPNLPIACRDLARIFQSDTPDEGFEPFTELAQIWEHVKRRELLVSSALDLDLTHLEVDGATVDAMQRELNARLHEAAEAIQKGDTVLLGDLLEYELAPHAEREAAIVALLQERAAALPR